jgi:hypothetical protein
VDLQYQRFQVVPSGERVRLQVNVLNTPNTALSWKAQGVPGLVLTTGSSAVQQGTFDAEGYYRAPMKGNYAWSVQAWSEEDPRQFAQSVIWALDMDSNGDGDVDALDMADIAMLTYVPAGLKKAINPYALYGPNSSIADWDVQLVTQAFHNAFTR